MNFKTDTAKIRRWREERHWSQEHLAEVAGIGLRTLQRIERGQAASSETLMALANAFNVSVVALAIDPEVEAAQIVRTKQAKDLRSLRLSLFIHAACYVVVVAIFITINIGLGAFVMKWPLTRSQTRSDDPCSLRTKRHFQTSEVVARRRKAGICSAVPITVATTQRDTGRIQTGDFSNKVKGTMVGDVGFEPTTR